MVKKDKQAAAAAKKQRTLQKSVKKATKNKTAKNSKKDAEEEDDQDIDEILRQYEAQMEAKKVITEETCEAPPSTRINASLTQNPLRPELFLFGGEHYDGHLASFFNELYIYSIPKNQWKKNTSPTSPLPRSSHQVVVHKDQLWLFGGEFSSPKQNTFYHYGDFWILDPADRAWTKIDTRPSPSARSGHRMISYDHYILLYGGFQDTANETKYLDDLWVFDTDEYKWHECKLPPIAQRPDARSGFIFVPGKEEAILFGGYSKKKIGGKIYKGVVHNDYWSLNLKGAEPAMWTWAKRKRPAAPPSPRIGASTALHKGRLILFGGVFDTKEGEEMLESIFHNDLFCLTVEAGRWFPLKARPARRQVARKQIDTRKRERYDRENDLLANEKLIQVRITGDDTQTESNLIDDESKEEHEESESFKITDIPLTMNMPHVRFNAAVAVSGDTLYIYGGVYENGEKEYALNDLHAIDLAKLDGIRMIFGNPIEEQVESEDEDEADDGEDDDDEGDDEGEEGECRSEAATETWIVPHPDAVDTTESKGDHDTDPEPIDPRPFPKPFETIKSYFARTAEAWIIHILPWNQTLAGKELRTKAFSKADEYWWAVREQVRELEDNYEDSGIGAVVEKEDGKGTAGTAGKRR